MPAQHPFAQYIRILGRGKKGSRSLSFEEAREAMTMIVSGEVEPMQLGAFLMLLRVKEESPGELAGFVTAIRNSIELPDTLRPADLDWSSYAGKRQHHPWYLLAALALADNGTRVYMHGTSGHTEGRLYSEDALSEINIPICRDWDQAGCELSKNNFAYMPVAAFCPPMEQLLQLKPVLGLRSVANSLARLLNPTGAGTSLSSIFHPRYGEAQQQTLAILGQPNAGIFKGEGGEVERKPDANCELLEINDGTPLRQTWPRLLQGRAEKTATPDTRALLDLWRDDTVDDYGRQAVLGTLAIALKVLTVAEDMTDALKCAEVVWESRNRSRL